MVRIEVISSLGDAIRVLMFWSLLHLSIDKLLM